MSQTCKPVFFLTAAGEFKLLSKPRGCWFVRRLEDINRNDYMLVRIDPPLIGQSFGLGGEDITELLLATRHQGFSLFDAHLGAKEVYIARIVDPAVLAATRFSSEQVQLIAWGTVFNDVASAMTRASQLEAELL